MISHDILSHVNGILFLRYVTTGSGSPSTTHWSNISVSSNRQLYGETIVNEMILIGTEERETQRDRVRQTKMRITDKKRRQKGRKRRTREKSKIWKGKIRPGGS